MKRIIITVILSVAFICSCSTVTTQNDEPGDVIKVNLIKSGSLIYPEEARVKQYEGDVGLLLLVNTEGEVSTAKIVKSSGHSVLDSAALNYSSNILFEPILVNDHPTTRWVKWGVNFRLFNVESVNGGAKNINVLVYTKANGYKHQSRLDGIKMFRNLAHNYHFQTDFTEDSTKFNDENLSRYDVIVFLNTSGNVLGESGKAAFKKFINNGGGFLGIHSAADTENQWDWYNGLIGYKEYGTSSSKLATVSVVDRNNPSTKNLPEKWSCENEWLTWKKDNSSDIDLLLSIKSVDGNDFNPVTWCHKYDGGRAWYTSIGHLPENFIEKNFQQHILGGLIWASGN